MSEDLLCVKTKLQARENKTADTTEYEPKRKHYSGNQLITAKKRECFANNQSLSDHGTEPGCENRPIDPLHRLSVNKKVPKSRH
jgi:hypothetical protein